MGFAGSRSRRARRRRTRRGRRMPAAPGQAATDAIRAGAHRRRSFQQPDRPDPESDRAHEHDLERPEQVLEAAAEEEDQGSAGERKEWSGPPSQEREDTCRNENVQPDEDRVVWDIGSQPDQLHDRSEEDDVNRCPVFAVGREPGCRIEQRAALDVVPLVAVEREASAHPDEDRPGGHRDHSEYPTGGHRRRVRVAARDNRDHPTAHAERVTAVKRARATPASVAAGRYVNVTVCSPAGIATPRRAS